MRARHVTRAAARSLVASLALLPATAVAQAGGGAPARPITMLGGSTAHARGTLDAVSVGEGVAEVLVTLHVAPGWHISWRNPGETGLPTRLLWSLPSGVAVTAERWPVPVVTHTPVGVTHTLEGAVPWLVTLRTPVGMGADRLVGVTLRYGICRDVCIPEQLTVQGEVPVRGGSVVPVSPALRSRLVSEAPPVAGRRRSSTSLCLDRPPGGSGPAEVIADTGTALDGAVRMRPSGRAALLTIPAAATPRHGTPLLFVRGTAAVSARLDLRAPAPGCGRR
ncbi:MAG: hypothetical protein IT355_21025 [Gemmatimonadaceae bacterium]|nr:hypothetical protein [Gemmatimonadaceae bacterium]